MAYDDGEVRQQLSIAFRAKLLGAERDCDGGTAALTS
jgi:hypothetical protein